MQQNIKTINDQDLNKCKMWQKPKDINENLCVVSLGPVVSRPALTKHKVVRTVDLAHRSLNILMMVMMITVTMICWSYDI